jgi:hypothetical protein
MPRSLRAKGLRRRLAPTSCEVITQFQSDSARTDTPVRVRYAQPGSQVSVGEHASGYHILTMTISRARTNHRRPFGLSVRRFLRPAGRRVFEVLLPPIGRHVE